MTRPTGAAVRGQIERLLSDARAERARDVELTVIDFSHVSMIDFSCADEVVAKLLLRYASDDPPVEAYFVFRGVSHDHWDAIETVLERHGLALLIEHDEGVQIVGVLTEEERRTWDVVSRLGAADAGEVADVLHADEIDVQCTLDALWRRRLVMQLDGRFMVVGRGAEGVPHDR